MDAPSIIARARADGRPSLDERAGKQILAGYGVAVPKSAVAPDSAGIDGALDGLAFPVVAKVMSAEILHKSDAGGVRLNLASPGDVRDAVAAMEEAPGVKGRKVDGYLIEEMVPKGREVVVGGFRDPQFGPLVMVGLGGIFIETLGDVAFRICPIAERDAAAMLDEVRGAALLDGARGQEPASRAAIVDVLLKLGGEEGVLMRLKDDVSELDVNPLIVSRAAAVAVDARFVLSSGAAAGVAGAASGEDRPADPIERFERLFAPKAVGVVGASASGAPRASGATMANTFIGRLRGYGYEGPIYPIHPSAQEVDGLTAYPSLAATPEPIDYCYIAIGAARVPEMLESAKGRVKFAQVISSGFGEVPHGVDLEKNLLAAGRKGGCRVLGPNCLGLYSPRGKVSFAQSAPEELGHVGVISQSGGLGTDIITRGDRRGVRFSGLVTVGNSADLGPTDLLEFYLADPQTKVVGMYVEGVRDGRRLFDALRASNGEKPVAILKGGRTQKGQAAAASHTGALAGDDRVWVALARQAGCVLVDTLDEFVDVLLGFQALTPRRDRATHRVALFGNGGGASVLAADFFYRRGLSIDPFSGAAQDALAALDLPPGASIANPVDAPVGALQREGGKIAEKILDAIYAGARPEAVVMHLNLAAFVGRGPIDPLDNLIRAAERVREHYPGQAHFVLVLRSSGAPEVEEGKRAYTRRALDAGIPVFDELGDAALALSAVSRYEAFLAGRGS